MFFALRSVTLLFPLSQSGNFTIRTSLFTIHNCSYAFLHTNRGHSPLRLAPRFLRQRTLTAEEWTRQSTSLPCCFFWLSPLLPMPLMNLPLLLLHIAVSHFLRSLHSLLSSAAPQPGKYGSLALGSSSSLALRSGRFTAFTVTLGDDFACTESLSQLAPRIPLHLSTFPLERR